MNPLRNGLGVLTLSILAAGAAAQEGTLLRYQPSKEPLIYRKTNTMKQTQNVMDKKIDTDTKQTEVEVWSVSATDKKDLEIKSETKTLEVKVAIGPLGDYKFDSRKDDNDKGSALGAALTPLYERLAGARPTYVVSDRGKIAKVEGLKELLEDVIKDNPIAKQFAAGGSEEAWKLGLAEYFLSLPEEKVAPGTRWETPFQISLDKFGKANGKRIYVCDGEATVGKRKTIKISVTTEMAFDLDLDAGEAKVTGKMSITDSKGTIHFDPKQGCVVSMNNQYTLGGDLNVTAGGMNIPVSSEQTQNLRLELLEKLPEEK
jgi:hypothetical protein